MKKYGNAETFVNTLKSNKSINLSDSKEDDKKNEETITTLPIPQELSISEQKQVLESLKSELLVEQEVVQSVQTDKGPTLSERKK